MSDLLSYSLSVCMTNVYVCETAEACVHCDARVGHMRNGFKSSNGKPDIFLTERDKSRHLQVSGTYSLKKENPFVLNFLAGLNQGY